MSTSTSKTTRRRLLQHTAAVGGATAALTVPGVGAAVARDGRGAANPADFGAVTVGPDDPRYPELTHGTNQRWVGRPDHIRLVSSAEQVVAAVQRAVRDGKRIAVRSGGHCYEDFVNNSEVQVVIDMSEMAEITYDARRRAFAVEPGAMLSEVYDKLYKVWGVTIPGGSCPSVGAGGHIVGGGYGALSRKFGLTVDHLYGVEVVVVDESGTARRVVATRDSTDPELRELWWAHTGGGGGNFGVITKYWLRSPGATGDDPSRLLPRPPAELLVSTVSWPWEGLTKQGFHRLLTNYATWFERNSAPDSPQLGLFSQLKPFHRSAGSIVMVTQIDATRPQAERELADFIAYVADGVGVPAQASKPQRLPWLHGTKWPGFAGGDPTLRFEDKSAYMRKAFPKSQLDAIHRQLTRTDYANSAALMIIAGYGGRINAVPSTATAVPQRDSILKLQYLAFWNDPAEDDRHVGWVRDFYQDVYAESGGVPVPGRVTDGCFINYADKEMSDPRWNKSGVPWHSLYYKGNYPRLRRAKATWDPGNVFRHALSIEGAEGRTD
ncbi:FAD-binding oxidoreductase [Streptomyces melanogenes]|uniref:FAD-binding protein n=1 Tax=Streptomyces melanogenes TaxID=67326 RepID=A0ABZ1XKN7_9ACTN|nr:FAD-binding protein [Streptomyces melanogenes]